MHRRLWRRGEPQLLELHRLCAQSHKARVRAWHADHVRGCHREAVQSMRVVVNRTESFSARGATRELSIEDPPVSSDA